MPTSKACIAGMGCIHSIADGEAFNACITNVGRDGKLELTTEEGEVRSYYF